MRTKWTQRKASSAIIITVTEWDDRQMRATSRTEKSVQEKWNVLDMNMNAMLIKQQFNIMCDFEWNGKYERHEQIEWGKKSK